MREGDYHAREAELENPSATSLRERLSCGENISDFVPAQAAEIYHSARQYDLFSGERAMLAGLRLLPGGGLEQNGARLGGALEQGHEGGAEKGSLEGVIAATKSKRYPRTRIQRLLLCAFLGITQEDLKRPVSHVRALAFDETGRGILRRMRETGELPIVNAGENRKMARCMI